MRTFSPPVQHSNSLLKPLRGCFQLLLNHGLETKHPTRGRTAARHLAALPFRLLRRGVIIVVVAAAMNVFSLSALQRARGGLRRRRGAATPAPMSDFAAAGLTPKVRAIRGNLGWDFNRRGFLHLRAEPTLRGLYWFSVCEEISNTPNHTATCVHKTVIWGD